MEKVKEFNTWREFCSFMQNFEGELVAKKTKLFHNGKLVAIKKPHTD